MKRTLIALGVAATVALPIVAQAAPQVYGRLNVSVNNVDVDGLATGDVWNVSSHASRFGVKGEDTLTPTLSAVYGIEWQVEADGVATDLAQRNRFVGVKSSNWGTIKLGKIDTYLKQAEGKVDQFGDLAGDIDSVLGAQAGRARANNVIDYYSPKIADSLNFGLQLIQNEAQPDGQATPDRGLADGISATVAYSGGPLWVALAYNKDVVGRLYGAIGNTAPAVGDNRIADSIRLAATYSLKDLGLNLGAIYQTAESDIAGSKAEQDGFIVSGALKVATDWTAKLQFGQSTTKFTGSADTDLTTISLGADYSLGKATRAYGYYTLNNLERGATDTDTTVYGIGLDHSF